MMASVSLKLPDKLALVKNSIIKLNLSLLRDTDVLLLNNALKLQCPRWHLAYWERHYFQVLHISADTKSLAH